jgi:O-methyltransferase
MVFVAKTVEKLASLSKYTITKRYSVDPIVDKEISQIFDRCKIFTMTSKERVYGLYEAVEYVINAKIDGDFVECGVWKGGSAMVIALALIEMGQTNRAIYLYDTFEGMPCPTTEDYMVLNSTAQSKLEWEKNNKIDHNDWCFSPKSEVKRNLLSTGFPEEKLIFVKGKVETTIPLTMPSKISLLRLDTDWYESTKHELIHLYPILEKNGVLILDDYGYWAGVKKAADEYFATFNAPILLNRIDRAGRIGIKT